MNRSRGKQILPCLALVAFLWLPHATAHAEYQAGVRAFKANDFATAWRELLTAQSEPYALVALGYMAESGHGTKTDLVAAVQFYEKAIAAGMPYAMVALGRMYDHGRGVKRDGAAAQRHYAMAVKAIATRKDIDADTKEIYWSARWLLAFLWARQGGLLEEALCLSTKLLSEYPNNPASPDLHGFILFRMNRLDESESYLRKAVAMERPFSLTWEHMGDFASARHDNTLAQAYWQKALESATLPDDVARLTRKLAGRTGDLIAHAPFDLDSNGLGKDCVSS